MEYDNVMAEETLFKTTFNKATRETFNPFTTTKTKIPVVYGHADGKIAVGWRPPTTDVHPSYRISDGSRLETPLDREISCITTPQTESSSCGSFV